MAAKDRSNRTTTPDQSIGDDRLNRLCRDWIAQLPFDLGSQKTDSVQGLPNVLSRPPEEGRGIEAGQDLIRASWGKVPGSAFRMILGRHRRLAKAVARRSSAHTQACDATASAIIAEAAAPRAIELTRTALHQSFYRTRGVWPNDCILLG